VKFEPPPPPPAEVDVDFLLEPPQPATSASTAIAAMLDATILTATFYQTKGGPAGPPFALACLPDAR